LDGPGTTPHATRFPARKASRFSGLSEYLAACLERQGLEIRAVRLMTNKLLELAGFPSLSAGWPYPAWRLADAFLNRIVPKPAFLCMLGIRPE